MDMRGVAKVQSGLGPLPRGTRNGTFRYKERPRRIRDLGKVAWDSIDGHVLGKTEVKQWRCMEAESGNQRERRRNAVAYKSTCAMYNYLESVYGCTGEVLRQGLCSTK